MSKNKFKSYDYDVFNDNTYVRSHYIGKKTDNMPKSASKKAHNLMTVLYFPIAVLWMEFFLKLASGLSVVNGIFYTALFSIPVAFLLTLLCTITKKSRLNRGFALGFTVIFSIWYSAQVLYYNVFGTFMVVSSIMNGGTHQAFNSFDMIMTAIQSKLFFLIMIFVPMMFQIIFGKKLSMFSHTRKILKTWIITIMVVVQCVALICINYSDNVRNLYYGELQKTKVCERFGLFTMQRLDVSHLLFGYNSRVNIVSEKEQSTPSEAVNEMPSEKIQPQIIDTDFEKLASEQSNDELKTVYEYFNSVTPSKTNQYTGKFKDYNIIFLSAESFSHYCIDKDLTPTLYKMYSEGFQFENFYSPTWGVSTTDGEYANLVGLIPKSGVWSFSQAAEDNISFPFTLGELCHKQNYKTVNAYHNHSYDYYDRDKYLTNIGYDYKAIGKGLDLGENVWPNSDLKMMEKTIDEYINSDSFSVYYMTVSGHGGYSYNTISERNFEFVENLDYSDEVKGYLAANIELDRAMEYLVDSLEKAGKLDNTLICLTDDHYPYSLDEFGGLDELAGHTVDTTFEKYKNAWLLWSGSMKEPVRVDTYCSSLDILPTLLNMLGFEYDSRTLIGTDVFGGKEPLVVFDDRSWISQNGKYNSVTGEYIKFKNAKGEDDIETLNNKCSNMFTISRMILDNNAYTGIYGDTHIVGK